MTILVWPEVLVPRQCHVEIRNAARSGGVALNGQEQRVFSGAARWEITLAEIPIHTRQQVDAYRALIGRLRNGEDINVKVFDVWRPANFGGDTGALTADAALRATALQLDGVGIDVNAGSHFSLGDRYLHRIIEETGEVSAWVGVLASILGEDVWSDEAVWVDDPNISLGIKITPPLRTAMTSGAVVQFNDLVCRCVLKDVDDGDLDLAMGRIGFATLTFVESIQTL